MGDIGDNDVHMAAASKAVIYGFSVEVPTNVKKLAAREGVPLHVCNVRYELIDDLKLRMEELLKPEVKETELGKLIVKGVFKITQKDLIVGGQVTKGKVMPGAIVRITREGKQIGEAEVVNVQKNQEDVKELREGDTGGLELKTTKKINAKEEDKLQFISIETIKRTL